MKTASSLAVGKEQILGYSHIMWALDFMVVFCGACQQMVGGLALLHVQP